MKLNEEQKKFLELYNKGDDLNVGQIMFVVKGNCLSQWDSIERNEIKKLSVQANRIKKKLLDSGLITEKIIVRQKKRKKVVDTDAFVRQTAKHIKKAKSPEHADAIAAKALTSKEMDKLIPPKPPAPADIQTLTQDGERVKKQHVLNIYDWFLQQKGLPSLTQKDHMEGFLTALAYNCATVEEYEDNNGNIRRQVRQPAAAIQAVKTLAEMGGHLQPSGQINIQVNNIWQEIATKRMKELNIDVSDTDGEKTTS